MSELSERLDLAVRIALEASAIPRRYFQRDDVAVDVKADDSPVTRADRETEELMRRRLVATCPDDTVLGEEFGTTPGTSGWTWYLDPIDGTRSFVRGVPLFGTMIALARGGDPVVGVITFPALGEVVYAARGSGAWWASNAAGATDMDDLEPRRARVSAVGRLHEATLSTTGMVRPLTDPAIGDAWLRLLRAVGAGKGYPDCYGHYLVARGDIEVMLDPLVSTWDNAPLLPIVTEAGGGFTDLLGRAVIDGGSGLSTNGLLHDAVLPFFRSAPEPGART